MCYVVGLRPHLDEKGAPIRWRMRDHTEQADWYVEDLRNGRSIFAGIAPTPTFPNPQPRFLKQGCKDPSGAHWWARGTRGGRTGSQRQDKSPQTPPETEPLQSGE